MESASREATGPPADLIAVLLITNSSRGANLVFRWPPKPRIPLRLARPKPLEAMPVATLIDAGYAYSHNLSNEEAEDLLRDLDVHSERVWANSDYLWQRRSNATDGHQVAISSCGVDSKSDTTQPGPKSSEPSVQKSVSSYALWEDVIGYEAGFLAELLSPKPNMCHQKFELMVDELAFIGHPVHAKEDGGWAFAELSGRAGASASAAFSPENEDDLRGRTHDRPVPISQSKRVFQLVDEGEEGDTEDQPTGRPVHGLSRSASRSMSQRPGSLNTSPSSRRTTSSSVKQAPSLLKSFHLVLVLDRPDPSSLASTDLDRYIDAYYTQFAFKVTAAMLYEQGRSGFISQESDNLVKLREKCLSNESTSTAQKQIDNFFEQALRTSTLAFALRDAFEAVVTSSICQVMIDTVPVNVQLPPGHLDLLKVGIPGTQGSEETQNTQLGLDAWERDHGDDEDEGAEERLEDELRFGWKVPPLRPWKTVVLLGNSMNPADIIVAGRRVTSGNPMMDPKEALPRFIAVASPTMTLHAIAQAMSVDLETELYSLVRLLLYNRKAKILDVVRMVNVYTLPSVFPRPLFELTDKFATDFPRLSPLPVLLSAISLSHRTYASVVGLTPSPNQPSITHPQSPHRSEFFRVLLWLLMHDLLVMLHVRVRIFVPTEIKVAALKAQRAEKEQRAEMRARRKKRIAAAVNDNDTLNGTPASTTAAGRRSSLSPSDEQRQLSNSSLGVMSTLKREPHMKHRPAVSFDRVVSVENIEPSNVVHVDAPLNDEMAVGADDDTDDADVHPRDSKQSSTDFETSELEEEEDNDLKPSFLADPERAIRAKRRWLDEICRDQDENYVKGFRKITPFLNGKITTDEIMHRTGMDRMRLREIMRYFDDYLTLILHP